MGVICHVCGGSFPGAGPGPKWGHDTDKCKDETIAHLKAELLQAYDRERDLRSELAKLKPTPARFVFSPDTHF